MISQIENNLSRILFTLSLSLILLSCNTSKDENKYLSVTIEPQKYFLEQLVGDKYDVVCLIPQGANPESYDPAPSQMVTLAKSKAYFKVGFMGIENSMIDKISNDIKIDIVDCSKGVNIIEDASCGHDHEEHGEDDDHHHHHHAHVGGDPHYWNSIESAREILSNMLDYMVKMDSLHKDYFVANYDKELVKINRTDSTICAMLSKSDSKAFVIYHPALSYFAREYGLEQLSVEQEGKQPSPVQLKNLIDEAKEKNVKAVFIQQEFDVKNTEIIANQLQTKATTVNLLSYDWHGEMIKIAEIIAGKKEGNNE